MKPKRTYYADLTSMRPLHPAWSLWITDLVHLNVSLMFGRVLMTTRSWREYKKTGLWSATIWHEFRHRQQKLQAGYVRFALRYWFSRKWRARYEREAYEVTMAFMVYTDVVFRGGGGEFANQVADILSGWRYAWMMKHEEARSWAFDTLTELLEARAAGELSFQNTTDADGE